MIEDPDVYCAANLLNKQHGDEAPIHATTRADELAAPGDVEGAAVWKRIVKAVDALLAKERPAGVKLH